MDYRKVLDWFVWPGYAAALAAAGGGALAGSEIYGGKRWRQRFFQPSEAAKLAVILLTADLFGRRGRGAGRRMAAGLALLGVPAVLILVEPDLGTTLVLVPTVS